jgi:hypothetical protein
MMLATATTFCKMSMAGPLGGAARGSGSGTTNVEEDVDGGPPGGAASESDCDHH